ncbi:hypothetical protein CALCODRAFT_502042 [Calocera cornea HHB12733]|uniref:BZIP domain-containing protein n=1 Tax=Calocera cornea HHB12733 TaxID=1353952 RepID=A0A165DEA2_9BASI|nr:hypothetical protein CALCODRAFT_502042 [Calocera cornea HHB12733]
MLSAPLDAGRPHSATLPISKTLRTSRSSSPNSTIANSHTFTLSPHPSFIFDHSPPSTANSVCDQFAATLPVNDSQDKTLGLTLSNTWDFSSWICDSPSSITPDSANPEPVASDLSMIELPTWTFLEPSPSSTASSHATFPDAPPPTAEQSPDIALSSSWLDNAIAQHASDHEDTERREDEEHADRSPVRHSISDQMMDGYDMTSEVTDEAENTRELTETRTKLPEAERLRRQRARNREGARRWREKQRGEIERYKREALDEHIKLKRQEIANQILCKEVDNQKKHIQWLTFKLCEVNTSLRRLQAAAQEWSPDSLLAQMPHSLASSVPSSSATPQPISMQALSGFGKKSTSVAT